MWLHKMQGIFQKVDPLYGGCLTPLPTLPVALYPVPPFPNV